MTTENFSPAANAKPRGGGCGIISGFRTFPRAYDTAFVSGNMANSPEAAKRRIARAAAKPTLDG